MSSKYFPIFVGYQGRSLRILTSNEYLFITIIGITFFESTLYKKIVKLDIG